MVKSPEVMLFHAGGHERNKPTPVRESRLLLMWKKQRTDLGGHEGRRPSHQNMRLGRTGAGGLVGHGCREDGNGWSHDSNDGQSEGKRCPPHL